MPMTDDQLLEKLKEARDGIVNTRNLVLSDPKPNYNIDGQDIKWSDYLDSLNKAYDAIIKQITEFEGIYEEESVWYL